MSLFSLVLSSPPSISHSGHLLEDPFLVRGHLLLQLPLPLRPASLARTVVLLPHPPILLLLRQLLHLDPTPLRCLCCLLHLLSLHLLDEEAGGGLLHLIGEGKVGNLSVVHDPFEQVVCLA